MQCIMYPQNGGIAVIMPADCGLSMTEIARKDVPAGRAYRIIDAADIPADPATREAWEADFSQPDGYGLGATAWLSQQGAK